MFTIDELRALAAAKMVTDMLKGYPPRSQDRDLWQAHCRKVWLKLEDIIKELKVLNPNP